MTLTLETTTFPTRARRRPSEALPVLISVPKLTTRVRGPRPRGRRRLRREVRVAAYALLAILPASMALVAFTGERPATLAAGLTVERPAAVISLEPLEPVVVTVRRDLEPPVILPGILLPADTPEESSDGGH